MRLAVCLLVLVAAVAPARAGKAPRIGAAAATVIDAETGAEVWSKDADLVRPIASMTKIFVAMVVRKHGLRLDAWSEITEEDARSAEGGSKTRLPVGQQFRNRDLLRAMLMVSDNRAPTALARSVGLTRDQLIAEMNALARDLGLTHTKFVDPTGILENVSTAREMALALRETLEDPVLARIMRTRHIRIVSRDRKAKVDYRTTVQPLHDANYPVRGGKTGHTEGAGYCMIVAAEIAGRDYVIALLGMKDKKARGVEFDVVAKWLTASKKVVESRACPSSRPCAGPSS